MDLTRLYNLTTPELREEADRLGVSDTYAMSRGQLIHAIRSKADAPQQEGLLGRVFGFAKWAIQAAGETTSGRPAPRAEPVSASEPASVPEPASVSVSEPVSAPASVSAPEPEPEPASVSEPEPASASEPASAPVSVSEPAPAPEPEPPDETGPPSRPPAGVFARSNGLFEEPFPTRTMARILAEQGHFKRSLAIYARLLEDDPGDGELVAEADAVRADARTRRSHAPH